MFGVALEGNAADDARARAPPPRARSRSSSPWCPGGYGWVFPKGDHINLGVGGWASEGPRLREHLAPPLRAARRARRGARPPCAATACRCGAPGAASRAGRPAVVGDAAGPDRPVLGRRHVRGLHQLGARQRGGARRAGRPGRSRWSPTARRLERSLAGPRGHRLGGARGHRARPHRHLARAAHPPAGRFLAHRLASRPPEVEVPLIGGVERVARRVLGPQAL